MRWFLTFSLVWSTLAVADDKCSRLLAKQAKAISRIMEKSKPDLFTDEIQGRLHADGSSQRKVDRRNAKRDLAIKKKQKKPLTKAEMRLSQEARQEWQMAKAFEKDIEKLFKRNDLSEEAKYKLFFEKMTKERLRHLGVRKKNFVSASLKDVDENTSLYSKAMSKILGRYAGTHYNPTLNRIYTPKGRQQDIQHMMALLNKVEHSYRRNAQPRSNFWRLAKAREVFMALPTPTTPMHRFNIESRAIGAQWEAAKRIPELERKKVLMRLREEVASFDLEAQARRGSMSVKDLSSRLNLPERARAEIENNLKRQTIATLENAHLSKEEFLRVVMPVHGQRLKEMMKKHYFGVWRLYIAGVSITGLALAHSHKGTEKEKDEIIEQIPANDLKYLEEMFGSDLDELIGQ